MNLRWQKFLFYVVIKNVNFDTTFKFCFGVLITNLEFFKIPFYSQKLAIYSYSFLQGSIVGIILLSKESRKELPEKELKIRFYMKAPTLILKKSRITATEPPWTLPWESTTYVYAIQ